MEPKKYWWMCVEYIEMVKVAGGSGAGTGQSVVKEIVSDVHPFLYCKNNKIQLRSWQAITETEYNLFNELNNKQ